MKSATKTLLTIVWAVLITVAALAGFIGLFSLLDHQTARHKLAAEKAAKESESQKHLAERKAMAAKLIGEAQVKRDADHADTDYKRKKVTIKEWSFRVTDDYAGFAITDGPLLVIDFELTKPAEYRLVSATWGMKFYDRDNTLIKACSLTTKPETAFGPSVTTLTDHILLGFKNLQFKPSRISNMSLALDDMELIPFRQLEIGSASNKAEAPTSEEARLLAAFPGLTWTRQRFVDDGWLKPGQTLTTFFSKKGYPLFGITGKQIQYSFDKDKLFTCSFFVSDNSDLAKLNQSLISILGKSGDHVRGSDSDEWRWLIKGTSKSYKIALFSDGGDQGITIDIQ